MKLFMRQAFSIAWWVIAAVELFSGGNFYAPATLAMLSQVLANQEYNQ